MRSQDGTFAPVEDRRGRRDPRAHGRDLRDRRRQRQAPALAGGARPGAARAGRQHARSRRRRRSSSGSSQDIDEIESIKKPRTLKATLRPYQEQGFSWLVFLHEIGTGGVLADDMGLGKTVQTIALLLWRQGQEAEQQADALVVAPTSVVPNWVREIEKFAPSLRTLLLARRRPQGADRRARRRRRRSITSYALLRRDEEFLAELRAPLRDPRRGAAHQEPDERDRARGQAAQARAPPRADRHADRESPERDLVDLRLRVARACSAPSTRSRSVRAADRARRLKTAAERLRATIHRFILRRTKQRGRQGPARRRSSRTIMVPMADEQAKLYEQVLREVREQRHGRGRASRAWPRARSRSSPALTRLRQAACDPRLLGLAARVQRRRLAASSCALRELIAGGDRRRPPRARSSASSSTMLKLIRAALEEDGVTYEYLDGSTKDRMERVDHFNSDDRPCRCS